MLAILERICRGEGREEDIDTLEEIGAYQVDTALCALGQSAANPVLTTIRYFRDEYETHIREQSLPRRGVQGAVPLPHRSGEVHGLHGVREAVPVEGHRRGAEEAPRDPPGAVHQVRRLLRRLPVRRDPKVRTTGGRRMSQATSAATCQLTIDGTRVRPSRARRSSKRPGPRASASPPCATTPPWKPTAPAGCASWRSTLRGRTRLVTSCNYEAAEGLEVQTALRARAEEPAG